MKIVQAAEAKAKFSALLSDVERGETIDITRHGRTIARIVPVGTGEHERRRRAVQAILDRKKAGRKTGITTEEILSARDEGRKPL
ncbi:type II toxin-antitoxin system Phd/YefM family antitoxin [Kumtagia ephedrae]|jgi:prevent-host-death family protein|uniref:Antitoxin n=1 Tax=Kumtagia ephedrae TaxID=2116701 RepID=A0A2P7SF63_9HYPH|nr:type II toxin-antitoxin system prevent-host-death family antitoxin [Mesorhizobium ephedrae]PSJ61128.1 prevent-host-death family protein [Mesorhizobium ephedrae]